MRNTIILPKNKTGRFLRLGWERLYAEAGDGRALDEKGGKIESASGRRIFL